MLDPYVRHRRSMEKTYEPCPMVREMAKLASEFTAHELRTALVIRAAYERSLPPVDAGVKGGA